MRTWINKDATSLTWFRSSAAKPDYPRSEQISFFSALHDPRALHAVKWISASVKFWNGSYVGRYTVCTCPTLPTRSTSVKSSHHYHFGWGHSMSGAISKRLRLVDGSRDCGSAGPIDEFWEWSPPERVRLVLHLWWGEARSCSSVICTGEGSYMDN